MVYFYRQSIWQQAQSQNCKRYYNGAQLCSSRCCCGICPLRQLLPCVAVLLIAQPDGVSADSGLFTGYGCHPDVALAIQSAVLEAVQSRLTLISGSRDDLDFHQYQHCRQPAFQAQLWQHHRHAIAFVAPAPATPHQSANWLEWVRRVEQFYQQPVYGLDLTDSELSDTCDPAAGPWLAKPGHDQALLSATAGATAMKPIVRFCWPLYERRQYQANVALRHKCGRLCNWAMSAG